MGSGSEVCSANHRQLRRVTKEETMEMLGVPAFVFGLAGLSFAIMAHGLASKIDAKVNKLVKRIEELEKK